MKEKRAAIHIGTSGYSYNDWLGNFYPQFCSPKDFLRFYTSAFDTVEIDATFYRIPTPEMVKNWKKITPADFIFTAKFPRTVTHEGDLESRRRDLMAFIDVMKNLEEKQGPLLLQFPYSFNPSDHDAVLKGLLDDIPDGARVAVEVRNRKWLKSEFYRRLREREIGLCLIDHPWMPRMTEFTSGFLYIRFLGDHKKIEEDFSYERFSHDEDLKWWADLMEEFSREKGEVYAYFNNHYSGHSPTTARRMIEIINAANNIKA
ncbi:conserved hypothetical protein [Candidatus Zixiibacteriota bacterium]|nr:conserved hypothetical protein [candidate division Zixibacteria bacterium]